jgi:hypothetical protein
MMNVMVFNERISLISYNPMNWTKWGVQMYVASRVWKQLCCTFSGNIWRLDKARHKYNCIPSLSDNLDDVTCSRIFPDQFYNSSALAIKLLSLDCRLKEGKCQIYGRLLQVIPVKTSLVHNQPTTSSEMKSQT